MGLEQKRAGEAIVEVAFAVTGKGRALPAISNLLLRGLLADRMGGALDAWTISHDGLGAPIALFEGRQAPVHVSLSRTEGAAAACLSTEAPVGIDIEALQPKTGDGELAGLFFSAGERQALSEQSPETMAASFFRIWTLKEAYIKARGLGFGIDLPSFSVVGPGVLPALDDPAQAGAPWSLSSLSLPSGHVIGLAVAAVSPRLSLRPVMPSAASV